MNLSTRKPPNNDERKSTGWRGSPLVNKPSVLKRRPPPKKEKRRRDSRHPPMRKKKPTKQKTCLTLMELARAFPNIAQQVCFHPKQSTFNSFVGRVPRSKQKVAQWL